MGGMGRGGQLTQMVKLVSVKILRVRGQGRDGRTILDGI